MLNLKELKPADPASSTMLCFPNGWCTDPSNGHADLKDLQMSEPRAAAVVDALVQIASLHQLHHKTGICRVLQTSAIYLRRKAD